MARTHSQYVCQQCGYSQVGWAGKCPNCESWGSLVETIREEEKKSSFKNTSIKSQSLSSIPTKKTERTSTKISELDRVLGGGLAPGQIVLLAGDPGIGKSTILLQVANKLATVSKGVIYASGEESSQQIKLRADRLKVKSKNISLLEVTNIDSLLSTVEDQIDKIDPALLIVDSIQTMATNDLSGLPGSVGQVRECTRRLVNFGKKHSIPVILVGHVTKEGTVAGPAALAHIVDSVLWFEGDKSLTLRLLRAVKNRFGATDEVGIFEMTDIGLTPQIHPEKLFLTKGKKSVPGSSVSSMMQGTRPILVEIQSLVVPSKLAFPKRITQGIDARRLELLLAVLTKRSGLPLFEYDCFVNVAGGIKVTEPAADLAICLSVASSFFDKSLPGGLIAIGEVGLLGEVREVVAQEKRIKEAKRLGYSMPVTSHEFKYLNEAIKKYLR